MLGFDRGGAYPQVFTHCREQKAHWVTYRRAPLAVPAKLPVITTITYAGRTRQISWAEETVQLKDYGDARDPLSSPAGRLDPDRTATGAGRSPLAESGGGENFLKYASEYYGIDKICDYLATIETNAKLIRNPARDLANAAVRDAEKTLAAAERGLAVLLQDPGLSPAAKNDRIPGSQENITRPAPRWPPPSRPAGRSPRNYPAAASTPTREPRCCAPGAAACR